jgi:hypothetical protein
LTRIIMRAAAITAAALTTLAVTAGTALASVPRTAPATTPQCGTSCITIYSPVLGPDVTQWAFIPHSNGNATNAKPGAPLALKLAGNSESNADFTASTVTTTGEACAGGLFSPQSYVCLTYGGYSAGQWTGTDPVTEIQWSPYGNQSGLCAASPVTGWRGPVQLQPCGDGPWTLWVGDEANAVTAGGTTFMPWVDGMNRNMSQPLVLTLNSGSRRPANALRVEQLTLLTARTPRANQVWSVTCAKLGL